MPHKIEVWKRPHDSKFQFDVFTASGEIDPQTERQVRDSEIASGTAESEVEAWQGACHVVIELLEDALAPAPEPEPSE